MKFISIWLGWIGWMKLKVNFFSSILTGFTAFQQPFEEVPLRTIDVIFTLGKANENTHLL